MCPFDRALSLEQESRDWKQSMVSLGAGFRTPAVVARRSRRQSGVPETLHSCRLRVHAHCVGTAKSDQGIRCWNLLNWDGNASSSSSACTSSPPRKACPHRASSEQHGIEGDHCGGATGFNPLPTVTFLGRARPRHETLVIRDGFIYRLSAVDRGRCELRVSGAAGTFVPLGIPPHVRPTGSVVWAAAYVRGRD
jgi:hypothetical protein